MVFLANKRTGLFFRPRDASWGERYFHMPDPDGHELSFGAFAEAIWFFCWNVASKMDVGNARTLAVTAIGGRRFGTLHKPSRTFGVTAVLRRV